MSSTGGNGDQIGSTWTTAEDSAKSLIIVVALSMSSIFVRSTGTVELRPDVLDTNVVGTR